MDSLNKGGKIEREKRFRKFVCFSGTLWKNVTFFLTKDKL